MDGFNHLAILTADTERFVRCYEETFGAEVVGTQLMGEEGRLTLVRIGPQAEINLFEVNGNIQAERQTPMFGWGRLDTWHSAWPRWTPSEIRNRLMESGASDDFVHRLRSGPFCIFRIPTVSRVRSVSPTLMRAGILQSARHPGHPLRPCGGT